VELSDAQTFLEKRFGIDGDDVEYVDEGAWSRCFGFILNGSEMVIRFGRHLDDFQRVRIGSTVTRFAAAQTRDSSVSVVAIWTRNQVTNTDRYVATVTPLASDPAIQNAIADQITAQVFTYIDIKGLTTQAVDALAGRSAGAHGAGGKQLWGHLPGGLRPYGRCAGECSRHTERDRRRKDHYPVWLRWRPR